MEEESPYLVVVAGPNGAGKSTVATALLKDTLGVTEFVDADVIARGLSAFGTERVAFAAGRIMLQRIRQLAARRASFAFETTLASRGFLPWIAGLKNTGYQFHLLFLWLPSEELAIARVQERVRKGGHGVPEEVIRRRYRAGIRNFARGYKALTSTWRLYDNSRLVGPRLIARGRGMVVDEVREPFLWAEFGGEQ